MTKERAQTQLAQDTVLATVMLNVLTTLSSLLVQLILRAGIPKLQQARMGHAVLKWTFGRPTKSHPPTLYILATSQASIPAAVSNVVMLINATRVFATRTAVT